MPNISIFIFKPMQTYSGNFHVISCKKGPMRAEVSRTIKVIMQFFVVEFLFRAQFGVLVVQVVIKYLHIALLEIAAISKKGHIFILLQYLSQYNE